MVRAQVNKDLVSKSGSIIEKVTRYWDFSLGQSNIWINSREILQYDRSSCTKNSRQLERGQKKNAYMGDSRLRKISVFLFIHLILKN
jgi:hypothetical protein